MAPAHPHATGVAVYPALFPFCLKKKKKKQKRNMKRKRKRNKAGYTATPVACGWAGAVFEVSRVFRQEQ